MTAGEWWAAMALVMMFSAFAWAVVEVVRCTRRDAEYRLSRARAAAYGYRRVAIHYANQTGSAADVDLFAADIAAADGDDLTAADLRREAGAPDTRDT
jgi:hypothetical protein